MRSTFSALSLPSLPLILLLSCASTFTHAYPLGDNGTASPASVVLAPDGLARFTVLTERVVRMERRASHDGIFVDAPSLSFINRQLPVPSFTNVPNSTHCVVLKTARIELAYVCDPQHYAARGATAGTATVATPTGAYTGLGTCLSGWQRLSATDTSSSKRSPNYPKGLSNVTQAQCCAACAADPKCHGFIAVAPGGHPGRGFANCWPLLSWSGTVSNASRELYAPAAPFFAGNLAAVVQLQAQAPSATAYWTPGMKASGNLGGTISSWNEVNPASSFSSKLSPGPLSLQGWAVLDDSESPVFDREVRLPPPPSTTAGRSPAADGWPWASPRAGRGGTATATGMDTGVDWYLFGCGVDEPRACLRDLAALTGPIALPARSVLGVWWSHYEALSQKTFVDDVLAHYADGAIPLNHVVLDCDWHITQVPSGCKGFGGFTWNKTLFPDSSAFVSQLQAGAGENNPVGRPLKVALNTHSFLGVDHCQAQYAALAADLDWPGAAKRTTIPLNVSDVALMAPFFKDVLDAQDPPLDAWWVDGSLIKWASPVGSFASAQQNMAYYSYVHDSHDWLEGRAVGITGAAVAPGARRRPLQLGPRYGGLGQHRAGVGFSGDASSSWEVLRSEVNMTKTASNVLYAWWSHDIGGFFGTPTDELMLRWIQFGALAPILRTHGTKKGPSIRRIWKFPSYDLMRDAMLLRLTLVPYLYGAAREAWDTGVAMLRPLHVGWPSSYPMAYALGRRATRGDGDSSFGDFQYMIGDDILAAPVVTPANASSPDQPGPSGFIQASGTQQLRVWLPPSARGWVCWNTSALVAGPSKGGSGSDGGGDILTLVAVGPADVPLFVQAGAVLPLAPAGSLDANERGAVSWTVFPGGNGTAVNGTLYDDDGASDAFMRGGSSRTTATVVDGTASTTVQIGRAVRADASWDGAGLQARNTSVALRGRGGSGSSAGPASISCTVGGAPCSPAARWHVPAGHSLARPEGTLVIELGMHSLAETLNVEIVW